MLERAAARGQNLGSLVAKLLELLEMHGAETMEAAVAEANEHERVGHAPVRVALESRLRAQGRTPPRPVDIPDERIRNLSVPPADLASYDRLYEEDTDAETS